ncbi:unnamed protein product [Ilex paraguariensis]|uniref:Nodulation signaling pathway 2-like protein n=1 Tax=Ilex paraguariensis TaxID=185542 RepID=A0ABC8UQR2_9AQUA
MVPPEFLHPSWPYSSTINISSSLHEPHDHDYGFYMDAHINHSEFSYPFTTLEEEPSVVALSMPSCLATMFSDHNDYPGFPVLSDGLQVTLPPIDQSLDLEEFDPILNGETAAISVSLEKNENFLHSQHSPIDGQTNLACSYSMDSSDISMDLSSIPQSLTLPTEDTEIENQLSVVHLVLAYGEAMDNEQTELAEVITKRMSDKVSPVGEIVERLLYYLFQPLDKQSEYLKQESAKNFYTAFKAFYQIFPYGKFAHFAANLAILKAMPPNAEIVHIFDFDMAGGIQWSSMIESLGRQGRELRLISTKWGDEDSCNHPSPWRFEETKTRLYDHASSFGLKLKVDEMDLHDFISKIKQMNRECGRREWFAFNCMVGLPHMGRLKRRRDVMKFLMVAKEFFSQTALCNGNYPGIIILGDGDVWEKLKSFSSSFGSFLDGYLVHYQALLESIESNFPVHLGEARTAMECLFVAPFVSSLALLEKWEEIRECCDDLQSRVGFEGWKVTRESLMEAKEMVREGESLYGVRIEGENDNEMALEWRGIPLVKVSCWRN